MRFVSLLSKITVLSVVLMASLALQTQPANAMKNLPEELMPQDGKPLLMLDFYSHFCSTCKQIEPHYMLMKQEFKEEIHFRRINQADLSSVRYTDHFDVDGTPTYVLFDVSEEGKGKPVYQMKDYIALGVLQTQLRRFTHSLKSLNPSEAMPEKVTKILNDKKRYGVVAVQPSDCDHCSAFVPIFSALRLAEDETIHLETLKDTDPKVKAWLAEQDKREAMNKTNPEPKTEAKIAKKVPKVLSVKPLVTERYWILSPDNQILFAHVGEIEPNKLWAYAKKLSDMGLD